MHSSPISLMPMPDGTTLPAPASPTFGTETSPLAFSALLARTNPTVPGKAGASEAIAGAAPREGAGLAEAQEAAPLCAASQAPLLLAEADSVVGEDADALTVDTERRAASVRGEGPPSALVVPAKASSADTKPIGTDVNRSVPVASFKPEAPIPLLAQSHTIAPTSPDPMIPGAAPSFAGAPAIAGAPGAAPAPLTAADAAAVPTAETPAQQVVRALAVSPHERAVEVRLDPPHLGRVTVEFDFSSDQVKAVVSAQEADTLSLLRRGAGTLAKQLEAQGFVGVSIEFAESGGGERGREHPLPTAPARRIAMAVPVQADPGPAASSYAHGALDLRL